MEVTKVYVIYAEIPGITDVLNVKIGISIDVEDRLRGLQTSNPYKLDVITSFDAGVEAFKHEKHFHDLYAKYNTSGEWYKFGTEYFEDVVLPSMYKYFNEIEVIQGEAKANPNPTTNLQLDELLDGTDNTLNNIVSSKYVDKKIAIVKLEKAKTLVDDNKKKEYQEKIDFIQSVINYERDELRKDSLERLAIKTFKAQASAAKRRLEQFSMGYLVGCAT